MQIDREFIEQVLGDEGAIRPAGSREAQVDSAMDFSSMISRVCPDV